jgi:hypothetical protein
MSGRDDMAKLVAQYAELERVRVLKLKKTRVGI